MRFIWLLIVCLFATISLSSQATIITFEDTLAYPQFKNTDHSPFFSGDFSFLLEGSSSTVVINQYCNPNCPTNGTNYVLAPFGNFGSQPFSKLTMTKTDGSLFAFNGFDGAGSFNFNANGRPGFIPTQIDVVGTKLNGSFVQESFLIDKTANSKGELNFIRFLSSDSFKSLKSLTFASSGSTNPTYNGFSIDNIVVDRPKITPVSEAGNIGLVLIGLCLLVLQRRRQL